MSKTMNFEAYDLRKDKMENNDVISTRTSLSIKSNCNRQSFKTDSDEKRDVLGTRYEKITAYGSR